MSAEWVILHGGALGDLALTVWFALRALRPERDGEFRLVSRADLGDLSDCQPRISRATPEILGLHWLYGDGEALPSEALPGRIHGQRVLNALTGPEHVVHARLTQLGPRTLLSLDPAVEWHGDRHAVEQWWGRLEPSAHADLSPCPLEDNCALEIAPRLRDRGRALLAECGCDTDAVLIHPGSGGRAK
ncbi:MAG: hypothetical protein JXO22_09420, partial [Phycisphaerae bacterium]|nr:hypothetical protein [Phycisphaerae bacterium]